MTTQLSKMFSDETLAQEYLEFRRWRNNIECPECLSSKRITDRKDVYYRCNACKLDFTVRTGTIFKRSHIKPNKLVHAFYLFVISQKCISSAKLSRELGITQKSAWLLLRRILKVCGGHEDVVTGFNVSRELNRTVDKVLSYKPKPCV